MCAWASVIPVCSQLDPLCQLVDQTLRTSLGFSWVTQHYVSLCVTRGPDPPADLMGFCWPTCDGRLLQGPVSEDSRYNQLPKCVALVLTRILPVAISDGRRQV